jgi:hypothetical protein
MLFAPQRRNLIAEQSTHENRHRGNGQQDSRFGNALSAMDQVAQETEQGQQEKEA